MAGLTLPKSIGADLPVLPFSNTGSVQDLRTKMSEAERQASEASTKATQAGEREARLRETKSTEYAPLIEKAGKRIEEEQGKTVAPLDALPELKQTQISPEQTKEAFTTFLTFAMLGGALTRQPMLAAMNSMTAAMKGWQEGDTARTKAELESFDRNFKIAQAKRQGQIEERKAAYEKYKLDTDGLLNAEKQIALKYEDPIAAEHARKDDLIGLGKHYDVLAKNYETAIHHANQVEQQNRRLAEQEKRDQQRHQEVMSKMGGKEKPILTKDEKTGQMTFVYPDRPPGKQVVPIEGTENLQKFGMRPAKDALGGKGKGQSSNAQRFTDSMMVSANEISMMMDNVQNLPVSASTGFMGTSKKVNSIVDIPVRALGLSMTGEDARKYDAVTNGMGKALANLMTQGRVSSDKLMNVMAENKIQEGDSFSVAMIKTANIRQEVEAALEVMSHSPAASEDSINLIGKMRDRLRKSIPYTVNDVLKAENLADADPDMKFVDAVKQSGVVKPSDDHPTDIKEIMNKYGGRR